MKFRRIITFILTVIFIFNCIGAPLSVSAEGKVAKKRTIAIVYDNSGSMYINKNKAWCQAQYAMEVFATMMNKGDKLMVYPMWPVSPEGSKEVYTHQSNPLIITDDKQKSIIHTLKSDLTRGDYTPIESIDSAYNGLKGESGEKWLVVLTDGQTFYENQRELNVDNTKTALEKRFKKYSSDTNILYLGIGEKLKAPQIKPTGTNFYAARTTSSKNVPVVLTEMCNIIFGRDALPDNHVTKNTIDFDIPLSKLYVFIQGDGIGNVKLTDGSKTLKPSQTYTPIYGTAGCDSIYDVVLNFDVDKTLKGYIAVYDNLKSGTYNYSYSGKMSSIEFYYEVDADLKIDLINENGVSIKNAGEVAPGDYKIRYALVDKDGNALKSDLLGNVNYEIVYSVNGTETVEKKNSSGEKKVHIDENTEFVLKSGEVNFLNGYKIRKGGTELGFLSIPFKATKGSAKAMTITITGGAESVDCDRVSDLPAYLATVKYDGKELTGDQLKNVNFKANISSKDIAYDVKQTEKGFEIKIKPAKDVNIIPAGTYDISVEATVSSEKYKDAKAAASASLKVNDISDVLGVEFVDPTSVYSTINIKNEPKLIAKLTYNGEPLTKEQFAALKFNAEASGIDLIVEPLPDESAYAVSIDPEGNLEKGNYNIKCSATGLKDRAGRDMESSTAHDVKLQLLPQWLMVLLYLLLLLLLILLIIWFMRRPALPKKIKITNVSVIVDGEDMKNLKANVVYDKKGKKRNIKIKGTGDLSNANFSATLVAAKDSYRYLPSKKRKAMVVNGSVRASTYVDSVSIGNEKFVRDDNNKLMRVSRAEKDFNFPKGRISYSGQKEINGMPADYSITGDIKFE